MGSKTENDRDLRHCTVTCADIQNQKRTSTLLLSVFKTGCRMRVKQNEWQVKVTATSDETKCVVCLNEKMHNKISRRTVKRNVANE
jgi:hypothetical protein